jgi:hypothetical protein
MFIKKRVLYTGKGCEISIEVEGLNERLAFSSESGSGYTGDTLKQIEDNANSSVIAAKKFLVMLEDFKEAINDKAPAMLGYQGYASVKAQQKKDVEDKMDTILKNLKPYFKPEEGGDAI